MEENINKSYYQDSKKQWFAHAFCAYCCEFISDAPANADGDLGAMSDAVSGVKLHIRTCAKNPNKEKSLWEEIKE